MKKIEIKTTRLPDLHTEQRLSEYHLVSYGRFAFLNSGSSWFGDLRSSHPATTRTGWYWSIDSGGQLLVSPRGAQTDLELLKTTDSWLLDELVQYLIQLKLLPRAVVVSALR